MTHEEAIQNLKKLQKKYIFVDIRCKALDKAIANMEKCEVYDKPVEMEVCNFEDFTALMHVDCKINDTYITLPNKGFKGYVWKHARPIKPKVLSFHEWYAQYRSMDGDRNTNLWIGDVAEYWNEYTQYLNDNK